MKNDSGQIQYTNDNDIFINIKGYKTDLDDPVWIAPDASIVFPGTVDYKEIDLHIANSINNDVFGVVKGLKIV